MAQHWLIKARQIDGRWCYKTWRWWDVWWCRMLSMVMTMLPLMIMGKLITLIDNDIDNEERSKQPRVFEGFTRLADVRWHRQRWWKHLLILKHLIDWFLQQPAGITPVSISTGIIWRAPDNFITPLLPSLSLSTPLPKKNIIMEILPYPQESSEILGGLIWVNLNQFKNSKPRSLL